MERTREGLRRVDAAIRHRTLSRPVGAAGGGGGVVGRGRGRVAAHAALRATVGTLSSTDLHGPSGLLSLFLDDLVATYLRIIDRLRTA
jgi:hypothetical protein